MKHLPYCLLLLVFTASHFIILNSLRAAASLQSYSLDELNEFEKQIDFDRELIIDSEGYWAASANITSDVYNGKYPFPQPND